MWQTKNGETTYANLYVSLTDFKFKDGRLIEVCMKIEFHNQWLDFSYAPFTHYHLRFSESSDRQLRGHVLLVQGNGNSKKHEKEVGEVLLERM